MAYHQHGRGRGHRPLSGGGGHHGGHHGGGGHRFGGSGSFGPGWGWGPNVYLNDGPDVVIVPAVMPTSLPMPMLAAAPVPPTATVVAAPAGIPWGTVGALAALYLVLKG